MQIDDPLISYLEDLSNLSLSDAEKDRLKDELSRILSSMMLLNEVNTENVPEGSHPFDNVNAFREDEIRESLDRDLILKNAPVHSDKMFIAPKTME